MRTSTFLLPCLLLTAALAQAGVFPYKYRQEVLPNGLKCILVPLDNPGLVAYLTVVRTGSRDEIEPGHTGFAHFFEHMMFRGTDKYPADVYNQIHVQMGADENAFTSDDLTCYHLIFSKRYLPQIVETEADRFMNLKYAKPEFQKESKAILGEYNKSYANPFFQMEEKLFDTAYDVHTYKHTTMGFIKDIEDMPNQYDYSLQFFDRFYRPGNCVIAVVGDIDPEATLALIRTAYGDWKPGSYQGKVPQEPEQKAERTCHVDYKGETLPLLWLSYKVPAYDPASKEAAAVTMLGSLYFGKTSKLYQELVLKDQLVDFVDGSYSAHRDAYLFQIGARLKKADDLQAVQARIEAAIEEARTSPVDATRLADLKSNLKYSFLMGLDSTRGTAMSLIEPIELTGGLEAIDSFYKTVDGLTAADIQAAAQKYLVKNHRTVLTLTSGAK